VAQIPADIILRLKTEELDRKLKKVESRIGKLAAAEKSIPRGLAQQYEKLNAKLRTREKEVKKTALAEKVNTRELKKQTAELTKQKAERRNRIQSLQLGVGFPLLFGGGAGSVAGGALGALTDTGGGFGGQILFSALGQQIDTFIQNLGNLADSLDSAENILDGLADAGFRVSKELRKSVETLEDQGRFIAAYNVALGELERRFGPNAVQELSNYDAANAALQEEFSEAAGTLQRELLPALTLVTNAVAGLLGLINQSGGVLKFLAGLVPGVGRSIQAASAIGSEGARRITSSPTNAFGFQSNAGASAASENERLAREKQSADLVREINRNQEAINRAREEAARKELKHQQDVLKLVRDRALLEAKIIENQLKLQSQQRAFELERARAVEAGALARTAAQKQIAESSLKAFQTGGTSVAIQDRSDVESVFDYKLKQDYADIERQVQNLGNTLIQAGESTEAIERLTDTYRKTLRAAAEEANRLERGRFETTDELFTRRAAYLNQEAKILSEKDEKAKLLLEKQLVYAKALKKVQDAGLDPTEGAGKTFIDAVLAKFDAANNKLSFFEQNIVDLTNTVGVALKSAMETALVDTIAAAIAGADDLNDRLKATAASLLTTIGKAFVNAGVSGLAGNDGVGFFSFLKGGLEGRANGGPVDSATPYVVGERGPELFVPSSSGRIVNNADSRAALDRYTPTSSNFYSSNLNITTGPVMQMDNKDYISREDFERGLRQASDDGAKRGEAMTLRRLKNSRSTRTQLGM